MNNKSLIIYPTINTDILITVTTSNTENNLLDIFKLLIQTLNIETEVRIVSSTYVHPHGWILGSSTKYFNVTNSLRAVRQFLGKFDNYGGSDQIIAFLKIKLFLKNVRPDYLDIFKSKYQELYIAEDKPEDMSDKLYNQILNELGNLGNTNISNDNILDMQDNLFYGSDSDSDNGDEDESLNNDVDISAMQDDLFYGSDSDDGDEDESLDDNVDISAMQDALFYGSDDDDEIPS